MPFASLRLITDDIQRLVTFYETVTRLQATWFTPDFAEIATPACTLAIAATRTLQVYGGAVEWSGQSGAAILEFRVDDVDAESTRLAPIVGPLVQEPTTMPWGNRSLLLRDPDGTLVNLFTPVSAAARQRHGLAS